MLEDLEGIEKDLEEIAKRYTALLAIHGVQKLSNKVLNKNITNSRRSSPRVLRRKKGPNVKRNLNQKLRRLLNKTIDINYSEEEKERQKISIDKEIKDLQEKISKLPKKKRKLNPEININNALESDRPDAGESAENQNQVFLNDSSENQPCPRNNSPSFVDLTQGGKQKFLNGTIAHIIRQNPRKRSSSEMSSKQDSSEKRRRIVLDNDIKETDEYKEVRKIRQQKKNSKKIRRPKPSEKKRKPKPSKKKKIKRTTSKRNTKIN